MNSRVMRSLLWLAVPGLTATMSSKQWVWRSEPHQVQLAVGPDGAVSSDAAASNGSSAEEKAGDVAAVASALGATSSLVGSVFDAVGKSLGSSSVEVLHDATSVVGDLASEVATVGAAIAGGRGPPVKDTADKIAGLAGSLKGALGGASPVLGGLFAPSDVGGHRQGEINLALLWIFLGLLVAIGAGWLLPRTRARFAVHKGRPQPWVFGVLVSSYILLLPGLFEVLFSFIVKVKIFGFTIVVTENGGAPGAITKSSVGLVGELAHSGSTLGAYLVILYAMVVPALKLVLLILGECWRYSYNPAKVQAARTCIRVVQVISKWACPDMFAYILLLYLIRSIGERSPYIDTGAQLDIGFMCFSMFCICSTVSSLLISLPKQGVDDTHVPSPPPFLLRVCGRAGLLWATSALCLAFTALFTLGLLRPVMALRLDIGLLDLPAAAKTFALGLNLEEGVDANVDVIDCIQALGRWLVRGEASCVLALFMLAVCVVGLTTLNMVLVLLVAAGLKNPQPEKCQPSGTQEAQEEFAPEEQPRSEGGSSVVGSSEDEGAEKVRARQGWAVAAAHVVKHLCMLDVFVMAVVIVTLAAGVYQKQGLIITMSSGVWWLLAAEIVHQATYYQVMWSAEHLAEHKAEEAISAKGS